MPTNQYKPQLSMTNILGGQNPLSPTSNPLVQSTLGILNNPNYNNNIKKFDMLNGVAEFYDDNAVNNAPVAQPKLGLNQPGQPAQTAQPTQQPQMGGSLMSNIYQQNYASPNAIGNQPVGAPFPPVPQNQGAQPAQPAEQPGFFSGDWWSNPMNVANFQNIMGQLAQTVGAPGSWQANMGGAASQMGQNVLYNMYQQDVLRKLSQMYGGGGGQQPNPNQGATALNPAAVGALSPQMQQAALQGGMEQVNAPFDQAVKMATVYDKLRPPQARTSTPKIIESQYKPDENGNPTNEIDPNYIYKYQLDPTTGKQVRVGVEKRKPDSERNPTFHYSETNVSPKGVEDDKYVWEKFFNPITRESGYTGIKKLRDSKTPTGANAPADELYVRSIAAPTALNAVRQYFTSVGKLKEYRSIMEDLKEDLTKGGVDKTRLYSYLPNFIVDRYYSALDKSLGLPKQEVSKVVKDEFVDYLEPLRNKKMVEKNEIVDINGDLSLKRGTPKEGFFYDDLTNNVYHYIVKSNGLATFTPYEVYYEQTRK